MASSLWSFFFAWLPHLLLQLLQFLIFLLSFLSSFLRVITFLGKVRLNPFWLVKIFGSLWMVLIRVLHLLSPLQVLLPPRLILMLPRLFLLHLLPFLTRTTWCGTRPSDACDYDATLTEPVLSLTVGLSITSREIWEHLRQNFSQQSLANSTHTWFQLLSLQKGMKPVSEYLGFCKHLADQLASIGQPVPNGELVTYVLNGLGPEYEILVLALTNFPHLPMFNDLRARFLFMNPNMLWRMLRLLPPSILHGTLDVGHLLAVAIILLATIFWSTSVVSSYSWWTSHVAWSCWT